MRNEKYEKSLEIAELAVNYRSKGVVGFDLAGEEGGYPPKDHLDAFQFIQRENFNITIHAGEALVKNQFGRQFNFAELIELVMQQDY